MVIIKDVRVMVWEEKMDFSSGSTDKKMISSSI